MTQHLELVYRTATGRHHRALVADDEVTLCGRLTELMVFVGRGRCLDTESVAEQPRCVVCFGRPQGAA